MIIKICDLKKVLNKIPIDTDAIICYDNVLGFEIKNSNVDLSVYEQELNFLSSSEEFLTISDIENHLKLSRPTIIKLLNENDIPVLDLNTFKIKKSDYLLLLNKYYV